MTKMTYTVINRPKKDRAGRTSIGWRAECGREEVAVGGFLETSRTPPGEVRRYHAVMFKDGVRTSVGNNHETRAQAAFAIWRAYYSDWRDKQNSDKAYERSMEEAEAENRRLARVAKKAYRETHEGREAYQQVLRKRAKAKRDAMTPEQKAKMYAKRRAKRATARMMEALL